MTADDPGPGDPTPAGRRRAAIDCETLVRQRLSVIELASRLRNVSEACRRSRMDRASFYEWRRRYQALGFRGLADINPAPCADAASVPESVRQRIRTLALAHGANSCARIAAILALEGAHVAPAALQQVLDEQGLGRETDRWLHLEQAAREAHPLTDDQRAFVERHNPAFRERGAAPQAPGRLLVQDTLFAGTTRAGARLYLHAVVDCFAGYGFGRVDRSRRADAAIAVLADEVLPFYAARGTTVYAIETDGGAEFGGEARHPYRAYLARNRIAQRSPRPRVAHANGHMLRFAAIVRREFAAPGSVRPHDEAAAARHCAAWLAEHNGSTRPGGFPTFGRTPAEMLLAGLPCPA